MSRWEFMRRLEELLSDISPNEREEALQYYNDYFNDAGRENESSVIEALGSPEQVAKIVKEGLLEGAGQGEFTEKGFSDAVAEEQKNEVAERIFPEGGEESGFFQEEEKPKAQQETKSKTKEGSAGLGYCPDRDCLLFRIACHSGGSVRDRGSAPWSCGFGDGIGICFWTDSPDPFRGGSVALCGWYGLSALQPD